MVEQLYHFGIDQPQVLDAMLAVPRHFFVDSALSHLAYSNLSIPIAAGAGQTLSHPYTVAQQTQLLQLQPTDKVLEIGTGSGYQAAVLCAMGIQVFSIERQQALHIFAKNILAELGYQPTLVFGDGFEGLPQYAPFNKIIVTCGAASLPETLTTQLAVGGRMVIPIGDAEQELFCYDKPSATAPLICTSHGKCEFVPMLQRTVN
ncbi:protein-L-isoaspartate O-methyltransferase [Bacteroidia bacterium]|nr:protein-L-isoaspartate O-methyltransferase [Bacteroidia bacterium]